MRHSDSNEIYECQQALGCSPHPIHPVQDWAVMQQLVRRAPGGKKADDVDY